MFDGHMLKINGVEIPNKYIDMQTYKCTPHKRRVIDSWYDGAGGYHETYSGHTQTSIEFSTNGVFLKGRQAFITYFPAKTGLMVEYYNDETGEYETGTFRVNDFTFERYKIKGSNIIYKAMGIVLNED